MSEVHAIGRRKSSVARVFLQAGSGNIKINRRAYSEYLNNDVLRMKVRKPFEVLGLIPESFDIRILVNGGGVNGQAEAIRLGISRAFEKLSEEYRSPLKKEGLLRVDDRQVERKKYGKRKARRSTQFSKR